MKRSSIMSKVAKRREDKIQIAVSEDNWEEVSRLLDQPFENSLRRDRHYQVKSLNFQISENTTTEDLELVDYNDPLTILIQDELVKAIYKELETIDEVDKYILIRYVIEEESFAKISRTIKLSDKTVKRRYLKTVESLREALSC